MFFPISFERFIIEGIAAGEIKSNQIKFQDIEARYVSELEKWQTEVKFLLLLIYGRAGTPSLAIVQK